jgi:hypothetical protein
MVKSSFACVQLVECALQLFQLLSRLAELAFRREALVVRKVFGGLGDERIEIGRRLGSGGGCGGALRRLRRRVSKPVTQGKPRGAVLCSFPWTVLLLLAVGVNPEHLTHRPMVKCSADYGESTTDHQN